MIKPLNRTTSPATKMAEFPNVSIADVGASNQPQVVWIKTNEPVSRVDLVFKTGSLDQDYSSQLSALKALIFAGTKIKKEEEILQQLDLLGAYYGCESDLNHLTISLYSTPSLIKKAFPVFLNAILGAEFPEDKLEVFKIKKLAELSQNLTKSSYLASSKLLQNFYETPIISEPLTETDINQLTRKKVQTFHQQVIQSGLTIFSTSPDNLKEWLQKIIDQNVPHGTNRQKANIKFKSVYSNQHIQQETAVQTSVRAKMLTIGKNHEDYSATLFANMLLGGYFGSLLMQNIREDKGLTYGISTSINAQADYGIFNLKTDIKTGNIDLLKAELAAEVSNLQKGDFSDTDFDKTKSYTLGLLSKSCDDLFSNLDKTKAVYNQQLSSDFYKNLFSEIKSCTKETVVNAALKHITYKKIVLVTCGSEQY